MAGRSVQFDASTSSGGQSECCSGTIVSYRWAFGDGGEDTTPAPAHTYLAAGDFSVSLTVENDYGETATATSPLHVAPAPPPYPGGGPTTPGAGATERALVVPAVARASASHRRGARVLLVRLPVAFAPPEGVPAERACTGVVTLTARLGRGRAVTQAAPLQTLRGRCTATPRVLLAARGVGETIRMHLRFAGNADIAPWSLSKVVIAAR